VVGVKSVRFIDGTQVIYPGNVRFASAVAQSHANYLYFVERVRGMRNTSPMGTTKKSLAQTHPALAKEADGWDPKLVTAGSHKKLNWKCKDGHVWQNSVEMRTKRNQGCPYCSGKRIITGVNDLKTKSPEVAKQAFGWDPSIVSEFSGKKLDWKCEKGHVWNAGVHSRTGKSKTGCPYCSGRRPIKGETDLATTHPLLAKEALDLDATSVSAGSGQKVTWKCSEGHTWITSVSDRALGKKGCATCKNQRLLTGFNDLLTKFPAISKEAHGWDPSTELAGSGKKLAWKCKYGHEWSTTIAARTKNKSGCPVCMRKAVQPGENDLQTTHPSIASEAHNWDPTTVLAGTEKKVEWLCTEGHIYSARISGRTSKSSGCPYCANQKVLPGFNDLATIKPEIAKQADGWDPSQVLPGTQKKMKWKCINGHSYLAPPSARKDVESGCNICSNKVIVPGINDLQTTDPLIAHEAHGWDPKKYVRGSNETMDWKCPVGHIYQSAIGHRTARAQGCPICSNHITLKGFNDLQTTHPEIAKTAHGWDPSTVTMGSGLSRKWKCQIGHVWESVVSSRKTTGCPICSRQQLLSGFNDLATTNSNFALEADGWDPAQVITGGHRKYDWKCLKGHKWKASISSRKNMNSGCPYCANKKVLAGFNDLALTHPLLAAQAHGWDPTTVLAGNNKKAEWICESGHIWKSSIVSRASGIGCPTCSKTGFDPNKDGYLYFLVHKEWEMFQIGITNVPDDRLNSHRKLGWEVLEIRGPMDGHLTQNWETSILRMLKASGADLSNSKIAGKFDGYSEAWSMSAFDAKSIKFLMHSTEEFEDRKK